MSRRPYYQQRTEGAPWHDSSGSGGRGNWHASDEWYAAQENWRNANWWDRSSYDRDDRDWYDQWLDWKDDREDPRQHWPGNVPQRQEDDRQDRRTWRVADSSQDERRRTGQQTHQA